MINNSVINTSLENLYQLALCVGPLSWKEKNRIIKTLHSDNDNNSNETNNESIIFNGQVITKLSTSARSLVTF